MKKTFIILTICFSSLALYGQDYFHKIIDYPEGAPTITNVIQNETEIIISAINIQKNTFITRVNKDSFTPSFTKIENFSVTRDGISEFDNVTFLYGKDRSIIDNQEFIICEGEDKEHIQTRTTLPGQYVWPIAYNADTSGHYLGYDTSIDSLDRSTFGIQKRTPNGDLLWEYFYGIENGFSSVDEIGIAANGDAIIAGISNRIPPDFSFRSLLNVHRVSPDGELINTFFQEESAEVGEIAFVAPLLDNTVLAAVNVDRRQDIDFFNDNLYPFPYKLNWIDEDGDIIMDRLVITPRPYQLYLRNITASNHFDHFFLVGLCYEEETEIDYGYISKISYTGETLWERKYSHPDYNFQNNFQSLSEVIEFENGDIIATGVIGTIEGEKNIWIMKVNEDGCFGSGDDCGETVITTSTQEIGPENELIAYPNPASSILSVDNLNTNGNTAQITISNMSGYILKTLSTSAPDIQLNIDDLSSGMHLLKIEYPDGSSEYKKFIIVR